PGHPLHPGSTYPQPGRYPGPRPPQRLDHPRRGAGVVRLRSGARRHAPQPSAHTWADAVVREVTLALVLSSLVAGLIATTVMLGFLYLPLLWRGVHYDTLASLGGIVTGRSDERSKVIGALLLYLGGLLFALFYGLALVVLTRGE